MSVIFNEVVCYVRISGIALYPVKYIKSVLYVTLDFTYEFKTSVFRCTVR